MPTNIFLLLFEQFRETSFEFDDVIIFLNVLSLFASTALDLQAKHCKASRGTPMWPATSAEKSMRTGKAVFKLTSGSKANTLSS